MTATDELRAMLDERGVEWDGTTEYDEPTVEHALYTSWEVENEPAFVEYHDGNVLRLFDLTPEQAIEATLGSDLKAENAELRELVRDMYGYAFNREMELCNECACSCDGNCGACDEYDGACGIAKKRFEELYADRMVELGIEVDA